MCKQLVLLLMVLGFCISPVVYGANIVWVGETDDQNGDGVVDDVQWPIWLAEQGYSVDVQRNYWATLDAAKVEELNQADLVIVSRNTDSDVYDDGQEPSLWNSVTTPMILTTPYLSISVALRYWPERPHFAHVSRTMVAGYSAIARQLSTQKSSVTQLLLNAPEAPLASTWKGLC